MLNSTLKRSLKLHLTVHVFEPVKAFEMKQEGGKIWGGVVVDLHNKHGENNVTVMMSIRCLQSFYSFLFNSIPHCSVHTI